MEMPSDDDQSGPRFGLLGWAIMAFVVIVILVAMIVATATLGARHARRVAIVTISELVPGDRGTLRMKYKIELRGTDLTCRLSKRIGASVPFYEEAFVSDSSSNWLLPTYGNSDEIGEGSFQLGDCSTSQLMATPRMVELEPGQEFVVATCRDESGRPVDLFFSLASK